MALESELPLTTDASNTNLRMPAEWEQQAAIWFSWPTNAQTWPTNLDDARREFAQLVQTIAPTQRVNVMGDASARASSQTFLDSTIPVNWVSIPTNDAWARDYAPTFAKSNQHVLVAIDWHYNAWGGKYLPYDLDQQVARRIANHLGIEAHSPGICLEGGALEINSSGTLLCTRSCALDPNRNPNRNLHDIESVLKQSLGARSIIWLSGNAIDGDDTDGHIDQLARFTDDQTIVYACSHDSHDAQSEKLQQNLDDLRTGLKRAGLNRYRLIELPLPAPIEFCDRRIPASYCNFLITNDLVIVPQFGVDTDQQAIEILRPLFPTRRVLGLPSINLAVGLGSFHCLSQQQPS